MRKQFFIQHNGQAVQKQDIELISDTAAGADDAVLGELLRVAPYTSGTVARGGIPAASAMVTPETGTGSVRVAAFRAVVGERGAGDGRGIISAICSGGTVALAANASGNPRWDAVYAAVTLEVPGPTTTRKVKNPGSGVVTDEAVSLWVAPGVTLGVVTGTPAASPDWPSLPADTSGTFYIPLAYVRVPNGFGAASTIASAWIAEMAPALPVSRVTGAKTVGFPTSRQSLSTADQQAWGSSGTRPELFIEPTAVGGDSLIIPVDLTGGSPPPSGTVLDSRDWSKRLTRWTATVGATGGWPWMTSAGAVINSGTAINLTSPAANNRVLVGIGQTFTSAATAFACYLDGTQLADVSDTASLGVYCDLADGGKLKLWSNNGPAVKAVFWIDFSAPFAR